MLKNVISIIDGAAGSCGKAKVIGEIATDQNLNIGAAVTNCMPNAGHTFVDEDGKATIFRNIPVSSVNPNTELFIGPGSAIDMDVFIKEYETVQKYLQNRPIYVHELVPLICKRHKEYELHHIKTGTTFKGCGAVTMEKIIRYPVLDFFKGYKNAIVCSNDEWIDKLYNHLDNKNEYTILEGSQGCDLCLNHSGNYPYVTSRNVSTTALLADSGISAERLLETIMVIRPFPIRISNITKQGEFIYTGNYGHGTELTWTEINIASMYGTYPYPKDTDNYPNSLTEAKIKKLIRHCPETYLKQIFGPNYKNQKIEKITLNEALELERLVNKSHGKTIYQTNLIELPECTKDIPPNTIFDLSEQTTVTKMERRIFDLDINKLKNNCRINTPKELYLNFFQHLHQDFQNKKGNFEDFYFNKYLREYLSWLESETKTKISALGTGAKNNERILKRTLVKEITII